MTLKIISKPTLSIKPDKIIKFCISLIVFFLPLFFFPLTSSFLELNKMLFFDLLTLIAFLVWLINSVIKKGVILRQGLLNTLVIVFGLIYLLSSIFSVNLFLSFMGDGLSHGSMISILFFILFYFLVVNNVSGVTEGLRLLKLFLLSGSLIIIFYFAQLFGINVLPFDFAQNSAFNLVANSVSIFVIYLVVLLMIAFGFVVKGTRPLERIGGEILLLLIFALLFYLDQNIGWYLVILGLFAWLIFLSMQSKKLKAPWVVVPTILLILSLLFLFLYTPAFTWFNPPTDLKLDFQTSFTITKSSLAHSFLLGKGPETFLYAFHAFRPTSFNNSPLWQLHFDRAFNELFQLIAVSGLFAFLLFIIISLWILIRLGKESLLLVTVDEEWYFKVIILISFLIIFCSTLFQSFSATTSFIFWFLLGLSGILLNKKERRFNLQKSPGLNFAFSLLFSFLLIGAVTFVYFGVRIWLSDYYLASAQRIFNKTNDPNQARALIVQSVNLNPWLASSHLTLANNLVLSAKSALDQNDSTLAQGFFNQAQTETKLAIEQEPKNAYVYEQVASLYQSILNLGGNVDENEMTKTLEETVKLEPNNASVWLDFGKYYVFQAQTLKAAIAVAKEPGELNKKLMEALEKADEKIKKAGELKNNYWEADIVKAQALELQGKRTEAINLLVESVNRNPNNLTVLEEYGKILLLDNQLDNAENVFKSILVLAPSHANARFWLATIYEQRGEKDKAIAELELVLQTNPGNELVLQKLKKLKGS